jgi:hypothetical protein
MNVRFYKPAKFKATTETLAAAARADLEEAETKGLKLD